MLNIVIISADEQAILVLSKSLKKLSSYEIKIAGITSNLDEGIALLNKTQPDVVFLDIPMHERKGLDIYTELKSQHLKIIIFSSQEQCAIDALKIAASGFLLKPIDFIELQVTIKKVIKELEFEKKINQLEDEVKYLSSTDIHGENIIFDIESGFIMLNTRNIEYCHAENSYSCIFTYSKKEFVVTKSLKELQDILPKNQFYRTHKSYLVNIYYIRKYVHGKNSHVLMKSGIKIPVSIRVASNIANDIKNKLII